MTKKVFVSLVFLCLLASVWAFSEQEPNNNPADVNVIWCENGHHTGYFDYSGDVDYWYFNGFPGDSVTISTLGCTTLDTKITIYDASNAQVAYNDDFGGTYQSQITYSVPDDQSYHVKIEEYYGSTGAYGIDVSGEFYSFDVIPSYPYGFSLADGATDVNPDSLVIVWNFGDSSGGGSWNIAIGTDPYYLQPKYYFNSPIESREQGYVSSSPLAGGLTYYYMPVVYSVYNQLAPYQIRSFTTSATYQPLPCEENFDGDEYGFISMDSSGMWNRGNMETGNPQSAYSIIMPSSTAILMEKDIHDLSQYPDAYLKFDQVALMQADYDHAYVEYSLDGGGTWAVFPASSYFGSGVYDQPTGNNPEGPCFDMGSYAQWPGYASGTSLSEFFRTEWFDLSAWRNCSSFRIRFRAVYNGDDTGLGWIVDNFSLQFHPPMIPVSPMPIAGSLNANTNLLLSWTAAHATSYEIAFGSNPAALTVYGTTNPYWQALGLLPETTYYWKVRSINAFATSEWSALWSFQTQQYSTPWHQNPGLSIARVVFGSIDHSSGWDAYSYYGSITSQAQCGVDLPISVYLAGGYGPEGVRVWVDTNRDAVFDNNPAGGEFWDIPWGISCFQGVVHLPSHLAASPTRMRIQAIHTDGSDYLHPAGVFNYGETEDYLLYTTDNPVLAYSPAAATFQDTPRGFGSDPVSFNFWNTGGQSLNITLIGFEGAGSSSFSLPQGLSFPLALSTNTATVDIRFIPQVTGLITAQMLVRDNLTRTDHLIPLSGTGTEMGFGGAVSFSGGGYGVVPSTAAMNGLQAVTLEAWFKWNGAGNIQFLTGRNLEELELHTNPNNSLRFIPTTGVYVDSQANALIPGVWQHLACVYDPANSLGKIYIDGLDKTFQNNGPNPLSTPMQNSGADFYLARRGGGGYALAGCLDEVRVYNRALSQTEIRNHIQLLEQGSNPDLVAYWPMDETSGNRIWEAKNSLHATLVDMPAGHRIQTTVPLASGSSATCLVSQTGTDYSFPGLGASLRFSALEAAGEITMYKLDPPPASRSTLAQQTWLLRVYDSCSRSASLTCAVGEDIVAGQLPAYNFSLLERSLDTQATYNRICRATEADVNSNTLVFAPMSVSTGQLCVDWEALALPSAPQGLCISRTDGQVHLQWLPSVGASGYKVYSASSPDGSYSVDNSGSFAGASWTAPAGTQIRFYRVVAEVD